MVKGGQRSRLTRPRREVRDLVVGGEGCRVGHVGGDLVGVCPAADYADGGGVMNWGLFGVTLVLRLNVVLQLVGETGCRLGGKCRRGSPGPGDPHHVGLPSILGGLHVPRRSDNSGDHLFRGRGCPMYCPARR